MVKRCQSDITHETDLNRMLQITFKIFFWTSPYFWRLVSGLLALVINPPQPAFFATEHSSDSGAQPAKSRYCLTSGSRSLFLTELEKLNPGAQLVKSRELIFEEGT